MKRRSISGCVSIDYGITEIGFATINLPNGNMSILKKKTSIYRKKFFVLRSKQNVALIKMCLIFCNIFYIVCQKRFFSQKPKD